ncbi:ABC transporter permease, partial [Bacillus cereus]|nr:ABC transporter permease [Bacillus cereus]
VQELVKRHGFEDARKVTYVKLTATQKITLFNSEHEVPMTIISEKEYNAEVRKQKREQPTEVHNEPGSATMVMVDMS